VVILQRGPSLETCSDSGLISRDLDIPQKGDILFGVLVEVTSDLFVEDLVSLVDVRDWLVAVVLCLSLLLAEATCQLTPR
jgi:hypothetical protein